MDDSVLLESKTGADIDRLFIYLIVEYENRNYISIGLSVTIFTVSISYCY